MPKPLLAEYFCASCHTPFLNAFPLDSAGLCALCRQGLTGYDSAFAFGSYEGVLRELIHLFKYARVRPLAGPFGEMLGRAIPRHLRFDAVTPVPLHWIKRWRRGFNQSELLAREVARRMGVPVLDALCRARPTGSQAGLTRAQRRKNVAGAFTVRRGARVKGLRVLLVDDVLTTGATSGACAAALKRAGATYVSMLALGRADRRPIWPGADAGSISNTVGAG